MPWYSCLGTHLQEGCCHTWAGIRLGVQLCGSVPELEAVVVPAEVSLVPVDTRGVALSSNKDTWVGFVGGGDCNNAG